MDCDSIRGIILDYDGTVDIRGDKWSSVMLDAFRSAGVEVSLPALRRAAEAVGTYLVVDNLIQPTDNFTVMMQTCAGLMLKYMNDNSQIADRFVDTDHTAYTVARYCRDYMEAGFDIDRTALTMLSAQCPLVLVSRYYPNFGAMLDEFGLTPFFKKIIQSRSLGTDAGDGAVIQLGLETLGMESDEVLVVGQSLESDIAPALSLGCRAAWIADKHRDREVPDGVWRVSSLRMLAIEFCQHRH